MTKQLRKGDKLHGLVLANGGHATYQHVTILSRKRPDKITFPTSDVLPKLLVHDDVPLFDTTASGAAKIEVSLAVVRHRPRILNKTKCHVDILR